MEEPQQWDEKRQYGDAVVRLLTLVRAASTIDDGCLQLLLDPNHEDGGSLKAGIVTTT